MIRPGVTAKLFLGLFATSVVVALAMAIAMQASFARGFIGYLSQQEQQRVERLIPVLAQAYEENGGWDFLRGRQRGAWYSLMRAMDLGPSGVDESDGPADETLLGLNIRISLLDAELDYLAGARLDTVDIENLRAVTVNGELVGHVALLPFTQVSSAAAKAFEAQQRQATWVISGLSLLLAAVVATVLARLLMQPVRLIASGTRRLAVGDYEHRIQLNSRDELGRLADDFNLLALSLKKNEKLRKNFMADVSHELRTPLSILKGELEALEDGVRKLDGQSIRSLQTEVLALSQLVDDLYDLSLADLGALSYRKEPQDLRDVLSDALLQYRPRLAAQKIDVQYDMAEEPLMILADGGRLRQLFNNLLENVLKYTDAGGVLRLEATQQDDELVIVIQDSPPGVPAPLLNSLFDRLFRVETSRNRARGGAGLGLAICKKIVEGHDGTIQASHSELGGLCLTIRFPVNRS
ncbi:ATP-binding protein [Pseudohongiella sp. SYSU M77423]|uniref:ATP-binding protein n=1 Tax=unclassified Pseudohongiella TaxID=2629611 RepID=UPI001F1CB8B8|nr:MULTISPECIES: ATP-binding protein [unclassified Pseudohongiella]MDH7942312.1 ATP-binding protein [Pseudohongiella sp. SYSU M77423]